MALFSKAILGLFGGANDPAKDSASATSAPEAQKAYSKAGKVLKKGGKPVLTAPESTSEPAVHPEAADGMKNTPEPVMRDASDAQAGVPTKTTPGAAPAKNKLPPSMRPMTPERFDLIQRAMVVYRAKQGILASLTPEQRAKLTMMATQAFRVDAKGQKKT